MSASGPELQTDAEQAASIAARRINRWLRDITLGSPVTLLDTGLGSSAACARLLRDARRRGHALRVVSLIDPHTREPDAPDALDAFEFIQADPFTLIDQFGPNSFDFVITQLRVATLREVPRLTWLRIVDRLSTRGVVWIERAAAGGLNRVRINDLIERVGMDYLHITRPLASPYFIMRGRKPSPPA